MKKTNRSGGMRILLGAAALAGVSTLRRLGDRPPAVARERPPERRRPNPPARGTANKDKDRMAAARAGAAAPAGSLDPGKQSNVAMAVWTRIGRDNITLVSAGVAFYALLAIFPALAILVSIYAIFSDPSKVGSQLSILSGLLPPEAFKLITTGVQSFVAKSGSAKNDFALIIGLVFALWSARSGMSSLMTGLNIAYEESEKRSFIMQTLISLALTIGAIVAVVVSIAAVAILPAVLALIPTNAFISALLSWGRWPLLVVLALLGIAVVYRFAPCRTNPRWRWISIGSAVAAVLWLISSALFSFYVSHFSSYDGAYGSIGAVVVLLMWLWLTTVVVLIGAETDAELEKRRSARTT
ncbi:MAG TPA: YihY/virulence factor BrkB family protein [Beijerinckiaceae bacterium]|nr:YihY/virulence factor BrkB family protein [Beijerinckiaceae bacterium]